MFRGTRITNVALIVLFILSSISVLLKNADDGARLIGSVFGMLIWISPFYLAWRALGPTATHATVKTARRINIVIIPLIIIVALVMVYSGGTPNYPGAAIFIFVIPLVLNIKMLDRKKHALDDPVAAARDEKTRHTAESAVHYTSNNYIVRHWRGELTLPVSYWVNGLVLAGAAALILVKIVDVATKGASLRILAFTIIGTLIATILFWIWAVVGIWRSSNRHVSRGGAAGWAIMAKLMVALGVVVIGTKLFNNIAPQVKELALITIGDDPIGKLDVKVATDGHAIIVHGTLREGAADEITKILDATPGATSLVLNSNGGRLLEAERVAAEVRKRNLDTYVEDLCASACTYVFLAGKDRAATPNARIGFHQPSFPGADDRTKHTATEKMLAVYRTAGLPETFIKRVGATPHEDMWYPNRDELITANVVTRVSLGGEAATSSVWMRSKPELLLMLNSIPLYKAIEKRFPGSLAIIADRAWSAKERGANDADVFNQMRATVSEIYPKMIKTVDVPTLDVFVKLMIDQTTAARAVSTEACTKFLAGQLDITKTLPKELAEREQRFMLDALSSSPTSLPPPSQADASRAIRSASSHMPQKYRDVIANPTAYTNQPALRCDATIAFYQAVSELPSDERHIALRAIFQVD